jgi:mannose-6-phosphate isomerase
MAMSNKNKIFKLYGALQHYTWGGYQYISDLLEKKSNAETKPIAEYWMGAHDNAPAQLEGVGPLNEYIRQYPQVLGAAVQARFGRLPFLLKILDVKDMLSIQLHPTKKAAEIEFEKENSEGILLNAPNRNYKDNNHKPELMMALGDFWLLHGFRSEEHMRSVLANTPELNFLLAVFEKEGYKGLYEKVMMMDQELVNEILRPLLRRIIPLYESQSLAKNDPNFWAARAAVTYNRKGQCDRGIFSVYLLNLVYLKKGEAIFQDAGILHAYLEGQNVEIMANSDNVLRGGLTPKHIDVPELMKHVIFGPVVPSIIHGSPINETEQVFITPAPDFELSVIKINSDQFYRTIANTMDIFFVLKGSVEASNEHTRLLLNKGDAMAAASGANIELKAISGAELYRASAAVH